MKVRFPNLPTKFCAFTMCTTIQLVTGKPASTLSKDNEDLVVEITGATNDDIEKLRQKGYQLEKA